MSECVKCIRAQDLRDPLGAVYRARMRALVAALPPLWPLPDDHPKQVCIDCPACGGHYLVDEGDEWCFKCRWQLGQVEKHVGPPVETGWKIGDLVKRGWTIGRISYIDPSGFVDIVSSGWAIRVDDPAELESYRPPWAQGGGA